ncbi:MAG: TonB-dependent receptor [Calditrichaeota bacterium]|nr:MAG: TonB-dependent receptor [Calditrichota bacterium]MBL1205188.1 TonB-dependent receptor [Calditrichota bacterium]NOG45018.1 TonB-dependent receptor [Calditrichota bacterium]
MNIFTKLKEFLFVAAILCAQNLFAQTTGKIAGNVFDAVTDEALVGANVLVEGTAMGASVALDGSFFIINVPPGTYTISIEMIGYKSFKVEKLRVSVNRTAFVEANLELAVIEGEVIVVQAEKIATKKDQTSSMRTVSSEQMDLLPVENVGAVVAMQAGVVNGHFRGGRSNEVTYMVDGLQVDESFSGEGRTVELETQSIEDLEVITGTFNAEYGRAMSGVVNAVTKSGGDELKGTININSGTYITGNTNKFIGLDEVDYARNKDFTASLSGPVLPGKLFFFTNVRYQDRKNHLNGIRRYNVDDYSNYSSAEEELWYTEHTGDNKYEPMNDAINFSLLGKLTYNFSNAIKTSLLFTRNDDEWNGYNHGYKYNPNGVPTAYRETNMLSLQWSHSLGNEAFYQLNLSSIDNTGSWYLYENPLNKNYVHQGYSQSSEYTGFVSGGQQKGHSIRNSKNLNAKLDFTWQANKNHSLKVGLLFIQHDINNQASSVRDSLVDFGLEGANEILITEKGVEFPNYAPYLPGNETIYGDIYKVKPFEFGAYIQDKMEVEEMVINFGLRVDYFNPKTVYPTDRRNPDNNPQLSPTEYVDADEKIQISPRFGLAYQLGKKAVLRFSYGHFFQMPPMFALFQNNSFFLSPNDYQTTMGNAQLKAQKTIKYEMGLWQELFDGFGLEVALYYQDIYDLLSTKVITTYNQVEYGLYTNKDYGNSKGLEIKLDYKKNNLSAFLNYTLMFTRGNSDNPSQNYSRAGSNIDPVNRLIVMSWDQRHTLNGTVGYYTGSWGTTITGYYNSGSPYTWAPISLNPLVDINLPPNNDYRPARLSVDLNSYYKWNLDNNITLQLNLSIFNLLDELNENSVYSTTGRANTIIPDAASRDAHREDFNDYFDQFRNPAQYDAPRYVKLGLGVIF